MLPKKFTESAVSEIRVVLNSFACGFAMAATLNAPNSPSSWDPSAWERSILNSGEQAVAYMSSDLRRQAARLSEAATEENRRGIYLALCSSIFIGASFIIKKKGLILASQKGTRAGAGGYSYLTEPLWWVGMLTMIGGEFANFAAYAYAPAIVVTPLGASTIIISAILANFFLGESLHACGILACVLAVCGSLILLSHAPAEAPLESVEEIWALATQPQFLVYACLVISLSILLMYRFAPRYGRTHLLIYVLICSLVGSLSVVSCKALGIALKLTLRGSNQVFKKETFAFLCCVICCILVQMNYLNKVCARTLAGMPPRAAAPQPRLHTTPRDVTAARMVAVTPWRRPCDGSHARCCALPPPYHRGCALEAAHVA